jgi:hypothetical protein
MRLIIQMRGGKFDLSFVAADLSLYKSIQHIGELYWKVL